MRKLKELNPNRWMFHVYGNEIDHLIALLEGFPWLEECEVIIEKGDSPYARYFVVVMDAATYSLYLLSDLSQIFKKHDWNITPMSVFFFLENYLNENNNSRIENNS